MNLTDILSMNFFTSIFDFILQVIIAIIKIILIPIDYILLTYLPVVNDAVTNILTYISKIVSYFGWLLSSIGVPYTAIAIIAVYYIFKLTVPFVVWAIKMLIQWWHYLTP